MKVEQVMKQSVRSCGRDDSLNCAARIMWETDCGCVPVVDAEQRVIGMVTDRDVCMAAYIQGKPLAQIPVVEAMSRSVYACAPGDTIAEAERIMQENRVRRLPVLDDQDRLVGIVSLSDLVTEAEQVAARNRKSALAAVGDTLGAICRPHTSHAVQPTA